MTEQIHRLIDYGQHGMCVTVHDRSYKWITLRGLPLKEYIL
jgi:hypothetical protein